MAKYQTGLIVQNVKLLKKKEWYNQRFDGCLNLIWMIAELQIKAEKRKMVGGNCTSHFCIFEGQKADWYMDWIDIKRITNIFIKKSTADDSLGKKLIKRWSADDRKLMKFFIKLDHINFIKVSTKELGKLYFGLTDHYQEAISYSSLIDGFALGSDEIIQSAVNKLLDRRGIKQGRGAIFSALTASVHQSFINQAEISLLAIALRIKKFKNVSIALKDPAIKKSLTIHAARYYWTKNNYFDRYILTPAYFVKELKSILRSSVNLRQEITRVKNMPLANQRAKQKLIKELAPSRSLRNLLDVSADFTFWQDERKKRTVLFTHYAFGFLQEISRRFKIALAEAKCLSQSEVSALLVDGQIDRGELSKRVRKSFIYQKGDRYEIISGAQAEKVINAIF